MEEKEVEQLDFSMGSYSTLRAKTWEFRALAFYSYPEFLWGFAQAPPLLKDTENNLELLIRDRRQKNLNSLRVKLIMKNSKAGWFYLNQDCLYCLPVSPQIQTHSNNNHWSTMGVDGSWLRKNSAQIHLWSERCEETKTKANTSEVTEVIFKNFFALRSLIR